MLGTRCDNILPPAMNILPVPAFSHYAFQTPLDALCGPSVVLLHSSGWSQASCPQLGAPCQINLHSYLELPWDFLVQGSSSTPKICSSCLELEVVAGNTVCTRQNTKCCFLSLTIGHRSSLQQTLSQWSRCPAGSPPCGQH